MVDDFDLCQQMPVQTDVTVYLDDPAGSSVHVVCDGTSVEPRGSFWQRAEAALASPTPRGPYPVAGAFTLYVYEIRKDVVADTRILRTVCIRVVCEGAYARATLKTAHETRELDALQYVIGDDVVTTARRLLQSADGRSHAA
ncbi:hypothetical protein [Paraburkholderia graminis]